MSALTPVTCFLTFKIANFASRNQRMALLVHKCYKVSKNTIRVSIFIHLVTLPLVGYGLDDGPSSSFWIKFTFFAKESIAKSSK